MSERTRFCADAALTPDQRIADACVCVEDGRIARVGTVESCADFGGDVQRFDGCTLAPGFIDTHIHGADGADTMDATPEALDTIGRFLIRHGVTAWTPTTITNPIGDIRAALAVVRAAMGQKTPGCAEVLGAHLEGPYINPKMKGAQPEEYIRPIDVDEALDVCGDVVKIVTLAPEMPGALDLISALTERGINASAGHTDATYDVMTAAAERGLQAVTHGYNAQRALHHREPGVVGAAMANRVLRVEIICDLIHVHPGAILAMLNAKGDHKIVVISDAMRGAGLPDGISELGGHRVHLKDGKATLDDGTIAGSVTNLADEVRNLVQIGGVPLDSAIRMATANPAQSLQIQARKGYLVPGADADILALDGDLCVVATIQSGNVVYERA